MKTKSASRVENLLLTMLKENTGISMLDSGGDNGRSWQRNQGLTLAKLRKTPSVTVDTFGLSRAKSLADVGFTINVFHYLKGQLQLDGICDQFNRIQKKSDNWDSEIYGTSDKAFEYLESLGAELGREWNTYNGESNLSQILQGRNLEINGECYVILQIHGGADARGGYTDARLFKLDNDYCYDGGMLNPEDVDGCITRKDGTVIQVDNRQSYCTRLTDERGNDVDFNPETDSISLEIMT